MIIPNAFCLQRIAIKIKKQVAFSTAANTGDDLHKPVVPDGRELIYVKITFYHHFLTLVLHFGFKSPFRKAMLLYHNSCLLAIVTRIIYQIGVTRYYYTVSSMKMNSRPEVFARRAARRIFSA